MISIPGCSNYSQCTEKQHMFQTTNQYLSVFHRFWSLPTIANKPESRTSHKLANRRRLRITLAPHFNSSSRAQDTPLILDGVLWVSKWCNWPEIGIQVAYFLGYNMKHQPWSNIHPCSAGSCVFHFSASKVVVSSEGAWIAVSDRTSGRSLARAKRLIVADM